MVDTGDIIQYTDLVVAVGSVGPFPGKSEYTTVKELQEASQALTTEVLLPAELNPRGYH